MPGFTIHLAVGKIYMQEHKIEDVISFEKGVIAPDLMRDNEDSHFGPNSSNPDLNRYIRTVGIQNSYDEGYFLHLATDYLFYNRFLKRWDKIIYEDYDKLNAKLIEKYGINIPEEIKDIVQIKSGEPSLLNEEDVCKFIETVGKIDFRTIVMQKGDIHRKIENILEIEGDTL